MKLASETQWVLDAIEQALESAWEVQEVLPAGLEDPMKVLRRGCELLKDELTLPESVHAGSDDDSELKMAARNGRPIPEHVRARMNGDRSSAERRK